MGGGLEHEDARVALGELAALLEGCGFRASGFGLGVWGSGFRV